MKAGERKTTGRVLDLIEALRRSTKAPTQPGAPGGFHAHLDACERCRTRPFDLCSIGVAVLAAEVES